MKFAFTTAKILMVGLALLTGSCAMNRDSYADKEASRVIAIREEMYSVYGSCVSLIVNDPAYDNFWDKTILGPGDGRKLELLTLKKPVTKQYIELAKSVGKDFTACDAQAFPYAKSISQDFAQSYAKASGAVLEVYVNILNGKYKTYGELNQQMLNGVQTRMNIMQAANDKLADQYLAASKAERIAEQQRQAAAMAVFGAMAQGYATGYQNSNQSNQNNYQAPKTTNCRYIGSYLNCQSY